MAMRAPRIQDYTAGFLFSGMGGAPLGMESSSSHLGGKRARFRVVGGVDNNVGAARDFESLTGAPCLVADVHELQPAALRLAWGPVAPDVVVSSPPCKFASALLPERRAAEAAYQRMGLLALRGINLVLSTWDPGPRVLFIENVPGIRHRGAEMLTKLRQVLVAHGYAYAEGLHDCGVIGGLAQHRKRWFLIARRRDSLPRVVYQPAKRRVRACGEVLAELPLPLADAGGPMHALPKISWLTWLRLALVPPGGDWRDLPAEVPAWLREVPLQGTAAGASSFKGRPGLLGVQNWDVPASTVTAGATVTGGNTPASVADPRGRYVQNFRVLDWDEPARTVASASRPGSGAPCVADPRVRRRGHMGVLSWGDSTGTITGSAMPTRGTFSVADPRLTCRQRPGSYGVLDWTEPARTIAGAMQHDNGYGTVADPRPEAQPLVIPHDLSVRPVIAPVLVGPDGCWHRPLSPLECMALQGLPVRRRDGSWIVLDGTSATAWRDRIGNAIPPPAMQRIGDQLLAALLGADSQAAQAALELDPVWVYPHLYDAVAA